MYTRVDNAQQLLDFGGRNIRQLIQQIGVKRGLAFCGLYFLDLPGGTPSRLSGVRLLDFLHLQKTKMQAEPH